MKTIFFLGPFFGPLKKSKNKKQLKNIKVNNKSQRRQRFTYGSDSQVAHRLTAISSAWPAQLFSIESSTHR